MARKQALHAIATHARDLISTATLSKDGSWTDVRAFFTVTHWNGWEGGRFVTRTTLTPAPNREALLRDYLAKEQGLKPLEIDVVLGLIALEAQAA